MSMDVAAMDRPRSSHYETLGVDPRATPEQVERAYGFCLEMYGDDAMATYSLLTREEMRAIRQRVQEAYEVLRDPVRRHEYDVSQGLASPGAPIIPFPSAPPARGEEPPALEEAAPEPPPPARPEPLVLPGPVTGAALRRFREQRGVGLRDIADASKIGVRFLEYIEAERYSMLPAAVYLRGFLQEYARAVGLDPRRTAEAYMARLPTQT